MVSKDRQEYSRKVGLETETLFKNVMESRGNTVTKSSRIDDIYKHIDFYVNDFSVDVKGSRHLDCIWLETVNVQGNDGWLKGKADFIVFDVIELKSFCVFNRKELLSFTNTINEITDSKYDFLKLYSRTKWDRKDQLIKCRYDDIKHLQLQQIEY
tara:strand:- start:746 stop:1210 length:465 start_codon:yes stop_codon:yes gene_type:complete